MIPLFAVRLDNGATSQIGVLGIITVIYNVHETPGGPSSDSMARRRYIIQLGTGGAGTVATAAPSACHTGFTELRRTYGRMTHVDAFLWQSSIPMTLYCQ
jgi:hypothetical protein